jgi:hypothetical protein
VDGDAIRSKSLVTRKERGFRHLSGGNGTSLTVPQKSLLDALGKGWEAEFVVPTGNPLRGASHRPGIPTHYKIDLAFPERRMAVEIDGEGHRSLKQQARDRRKMLWLSSHGWKVIRVNNKDVLHYQSMVVDRIMSTM